MASLQCYESHPVMGDVREHESKGKYIKSAKVSTGGVPGWDAAMTNLVWPHSALFPEGSG